MIGQAKDTHRKFYTILCRPHYGTEGVVGEKVKDLEASDIEDLKGELTHRTVLLSWNPLEFQFYCQLDCKRTSRTATWGAEMEDLLVMLGVLLLLAACCGLPILLLRPVRLCNRNRNRPEEISSAQQERMHGINDSDRPTLDRR